ncbi:MAG: glycosyltransferase family 4 protein [Terracidiphilus sp.]
MSRSEHVLPKRMEVGPAGRKLQVAFVYSRMPFPMMRGDQLTVAHLLSFLTARGHEVDFFTLDADGHPSDEQKRWMHETCRNVNIYRQGNLLKIAGILRGLFRGLPMQVGIFTNNKLIRDVRKGVLEGKYDVLYVYYLRSAEVVSPALDAAQISKRVGRPVATYLAMQLSQTLNTFRIYQNCKGLIKKAIYGLELNLMRRYESIVWTRFTRSVLIGRSDLEAIKEECRTRNVPEIQNWFFCAHGTDVSRFYPASQLDIVPKRIVFSGNMQYVPNVQAILWFAENCWDAIRARVPSAELVIQGCDPLPDVKRLHGTRGIVVTGTVPDVGTNIRSAAVCINPMLAAGGMQNKLIEYLASAKAVVATTVANEGIGAVPGQHFLEANTADEFVSNIIELFENPHLAEQLGNNGRDYVLQEWTWEAHFMKLEKDFMTVLDGAALAQFQAHEDALAAESGISVH